MDPRTLMERDVVVRSDGGERKEREVVVGEVDLMRTSRPRALDIVTVMESGRSATNSSTGPRFSVVIVMGIQSNGRIPAAGLASEMVGGGK